MRQVTLTAASIRKGDLLWSVGEWWVVANVYQLDNQRVSIDLWNPYTYDYAYPIYDPHETVEAMIP